MIQSRLFNGYKVAASPVSTEVNGSIPKKGSKGPAVREIQQKLTSLGFGTKGIDGVFGSNTDNAVRQFQKSRGLKVDGIVSAETKNALGKTTTTKPTSPSTSVSLNESGTIKKGSKGAAVTEFNVSLLKKDIIQKVLTEYLVQIRIRQSANLKRHVV